MFFDFGGIFLAGGDDGQECADLYFLALWDGDESEGAGFEGFHGHGGLVGFDVGDFFAGFYFVALLFVPFDDGAFGHRVGELGHGDFGRHGAPPDCMQRGSGAEDSEMGRRCH